MNTVILGPDDPAAPVLTMLHGWGANLELVRPLGERMAALGYRVVMLDLPGFGQTPPPDVAWSVFHYAEAVATHLHSLGIDKTHLFGHSFGGRIGLILGAEDPRLIDKMVLADAAGIKPPTPFSVKARTAVYKSLRDGLSRIGLRGVSDKLRAAYAARYGSPDYQAVSGVMRETFVKVVNQDLRDWAVRVKASTLLLWGDKDDDTPVSAGRELERLIPDAGLVLFEGAGHYSYLERQADAARIMHTFLK
jgi:pimeloyl-ACP methyl ester carboxylesterase